MNIYGWLRRLSEQLPGWYVWYSRPGYWQAVPAPNDLRSSGMDYLELPGRLSGYRTPQALRQAAQDRYGWYDICETCDMEAHICGHRGPESQREHDDS